MLDGHHPFPYIYYACSSEKKEEVLCLCPGPPGFTYDFFWGSYPARRVFLKVDTRPTLVDT